MDEEEVKSYFESVAEDFGLELPNRVIKAFVVLAKELINEADITVDEIIEEFQRFGPDDSDVWNEYVEEISNYVFDLIEEDFDDNEISEE